MLMKIYSRVTDSIDYKPASIKQLVKLKNLLHLKIGKIGKLAECLNFDPISVTLVNRITLGDSFSTLTPSLLL